MSFNSTEYVIGYAIVLPKSEKLEKLILGKVIFKTGPLASEISQYRGIFGELSEHVQIKYTYIVTIQVKLRFILFFNTNFLGFICKQMIIETMNEKMQVHMNF